MVSERQLKEYAKNIVDNKEGYDIETAFKYFPRYFAIILYYVNILLIEQQRQDIDNMLILLPLVPAEHKPIIEREVMTNIQVYFENQAALAAYHKAKENLNNDNTISINLDSLYAAKLNLKIINASLEVADTKQKMRHYRFIINKNNNNVENLSKLRTSTIKCIVYLDTEETTYNEDVLETYYYGGFNVKK